MRVLLVPGIFAECLGESVTMFRYARQHLKEHGYSVALLATVEPRLRFVTPFIPLASIADTAREGGDPEQIAEGERLLQDLLAWAETR